MLLLLLFDDKKKCDKNVKPSEFIDIDRYFVEKPLNVLHTMSSCATINADEIQITARKTHREREKEKKRRKKNILILSATTKTCISACWTPYQNAVNNLNTKNPKNYCSRCGRFLNFRNSCIKMRERYEQTVWYSVRLDYAHTHMRCCKQKYNSIPILWTHIPATDWTEIAYGLL